MRIGQEERGFALVMVLWVALILAVIAASIIATARSEARLENTRYATAQLGAIAEGAINLTVLRMLDPAPAVHPSADGTPFALDFASRKVAMRVTDEAGKIDLNFAQGELLRRLIVAVGIEAQDAQALVDKVLDWREAGIGRRLNGAKAEDYRDAGLSYGPREAPFEAVEELQLVMGITPSLFERLAPSLTVYSQSAWADPVFAPREALAALTRMGAGSLSDILARRAAGDHAPVVIGHSFTIDAEVDDPSGLRVQRSAVVRLTGSPKLPLIIYRWN